jgi:hypothetical protein
LISGQLSRKVENLIIYSKVKVMGDSCPICFEKFTTPKQLTCCKGIICLGCLEELIYFKQVKTCPLCRGSLPNYFFGFKTANEKICSDSITIFCMLGSAMNYHRFLGLDKNTTVKDVKEIMSKKLTKAVDSLSIIDDHELPDDEQVTDAQMVYVAVDVTAPFVIYVKDLNGGLHIVPTQPGIKLYKFCDELSKQIMKPPDEMRIIYHGKQLDFEQIMNVPNRAVVHLVLRLRGD